MVPELGSLNVLRLVLISYHSQSYLEEILLVEEILHDLGCIKPYLQIINYVSTGAGFLPSTVVDTVFTQAPTAVQSWTTSRARGGKCTIARQATTVLANEAYYYQNEKSQLERFTRLQLAL